MKTPITFMRLYQKMGGKVSKQAKKQIKELEYRFFKKQKGVKYGDRKV